VARTLLDELVRWLRANLEKLSRMSDTAAPSPYVLNLWPTLLRYCDDGEIDNSAVERALRGVAIGRRNYLFAGADSGGGRAAAIYSLIGLPSSRVSAPKLGCATCWSGLPTILPTALTTSYLGTAWPSSG
jgi:hypothetical protein